MDDESHNPQIDVSVWASAPPNRASMLRHIPLWTGLSRESRRQVRADAESEEGVSPDAPGLLTHRYLFFRRLSHFRAWGLVKGRPDMVCILYHIGWSLSRRIGFYASRLQWRVR